MLDFDFLLRYTGNQKNTQTLRVITSIFSVCLLINIVCMVVLTDGECHLDQNHMGCITRFHVGDLFMAFCMILFDAGLFFSLCYKWYGIIEVPQVCGEQIPMVLIQAFLVQFVLTITAMLSCVFDAIMHLILTEYRHTMIFYLLDIMIIATCNFAMMKETQQKIFKGLCYCFQNTKLVKEFKARAASVSSDVDKNDGKSKTTQERLYIHAMASMDGSKDKGTKMNEIINVHLAPVSGSYHDSKDSESKGIRIEITDTDKRMEFVSESERKRDITPMSRGSLTISKQYASLDDIKVEEDPDQDVSVAQDVVKYHLNANSTPIDASNQKDSGFGGSTNTTPRHVIHPPVLGMDISKSIQ